MTRALLLSLPSRALPFKPLLWGGDPTRRENDTEERGMPRHTRGWDSTVGLWGSRPPRSARETLNCPPTDLKVWSFNPGTAILS